MLLLNFLFFCRRFLTILIQFALNNFKWRKKKKCLMLFDIFTWNHKAYLLKNIMTPGFFIEGICTRDHQRKYFIFISAQSSKLMFILSLSHYLAHYKKQIIKHQINDLIKSTFPLDSCRYIEVIIWFLLTAKEDPVQHRADIQEGILLSAADELSPQRG